LVASHELGVGTAIKRPLNGISLRPTW